MIVMLNYPKSMSGTLMRLLGTNTGPVEAKPHEINSGVLYLKGLSRDTWYMSRIEYCVVVEDNQSLDDLL